MKFSKPGETENVESGGNGSDTVDEMPMVESELCDELGFEPQPVDEMVATHGGLLAFHSLRVDELEDRVMELEKKNEELRESLQRVYEVMDEAESLEQFSKRGEPIP